MEGTSRAFGITSEIIPLSLPKGTEKLCELCQRPANLQCSECRVTFYCDAEHQQADWLGIHWRICPMLIPLRTPSLLSFEKACQIQLHLIKAELVEICRSVAQSKLSEGKHEEALPAAHFCLRCSIDVHGPNSVQLIPVYLLLAEANMGLGNLASVAELLSQAQWAVLQIPECGHEVYHRLHRSLGCLNTATGNLDAALVNFANDIYYASEEYGLDSTVTCRGHFLMADVFAKQGEITIARSLYSELARTWHGHLTKHLKTHIQNIENPRKLFEPSFDKFQLTEVDETLRTILDFWQNNPRKDSGQIALVALCLATLWFLGGDSLKALGFGNIALQACQLIRNHDLTEPIQGLLQLVQSAQTEPRPGSD
ncbi:zinc finger MYND domain-containing protein 12 [Notolabrus celidotus]|uniref:zinc finger MYND domain-containing protein 12 n=1 Tax=Notolabrus celidotus TaxID=1203425 RepID=UPI0014905235|nr:zinc finger MYND domain-containing protein 12 [Notolabrus celidotus]